MNPFTEPVTVSHYLAVGALLFVAGAICMATKRNALGVLMGVELVLNGANVNFVAFGSKYLRESTLGLDGELIALTPYTITSPAVLRAELKTVRQRGYALDDRENHAGMRCVAVPVLDQEGRAVAAHSVPTNLRQ